MDVLYSYPFDLEFAFLPKEHLILYLGYRFFSCTNTSVFWINHFYITRAVIKKGFVIYLNLLKLVGCWRCYCFLQLTFPKDLLQSKTRGPGEPVEHEEEVWIYKPGQML